MSELVVFKGFGRVLLGVLQALLPLLISFFIFQIFYLKLPANYIKNIIKGIILVLASRPLSPRRANWVFTRWPGDSGRYWAVHPTAGC